MLKKVIFFNLLICFNTFSSVYLGNLNTNQFDTNSINNPFGTYGNRYSSLSIHNEFGRYGSPYSLYSATNPYATCPPKLFDQKGLYLGKLSANKFDPESVGNPYSIYFQMIQCHTGIISIFGE